MYMTSVGNVGIGVASPTMQLELGRDEASKPASFAWRIDADQRLMDTIDMADLEVCYSNVKNMPLRTFKWREDVYTEDDVAARHMIGWTADDVANIFPASVTVHEAHDIADCKSLDVSQIIATMHGAMQRIQRIVEQQEERLVAMETRQVAPQQMAGTGDDQLRSDVVELGRTHVRMLNEQRDMSDDHQLQLDAIKSEIIQLRKGFISAMRSRDA